MAPANRDAPIEEMTGLLINMKMSPRKSNVPKTTPRAVLVEETTFTASRTETLGLLLDVDKKISSYVSGYIGIR